MPKQEEPSDARSRDSTFKGEFPFVHAYEWAAGQQVVIDTHPDHPMVRFRDGSGTFMAVTPTGGMEQLHVGDSRTYCKSGSTCTTDENSDSKTTGHSREVCGGGQHGECPGDNGSMAGGHVAVVVLGRANIRCQQAYVGTDGDFNLHCSGNFNCKVAGDMKMKVGGTYAHDATKISFNGGEAGDAGDTGPSTTTV